MDIVVGYDVDTTTPEGRRRLRRMAIVCKDYGQRVQFSLFECRVDPALYEEFESRLLQVVDPERDSLRVYSLAGPRAKSVRVWGKDRYFDFDDPLIL